MGEWGEAAVQQRIKRWRHDGGDADDGATAARATLGGRATISCHKPTRARAPCLSLAYGASSLIKLRSNS
jgi:hypothetical protein